MTARPTPTSPPSAAASKLAPPPTNTDPTTLLHPLATLTGTHPITLGPNVIIQLRSHLASTYAPLTIAAGAIISERASVGYLSPLPQPAPPPSPQSPPSAAATSPPSHPIETTIGEGVVIESGAVVEAASVGAYTTIGVGARIGKGAVVGGYCTICARVEVAEGEHVGEGIVVWGNGWGQRRRQGQVGRVREEEGRRRREVVDGLGGTLRGVWSLK